MMRYLKLVQISVRQYQQLNLDTCLFDHAMSLPLRNKFNSMFNEKHMEVGLYLVKYSIIKMHYLQYMRNLLKNKEI